MSESFESFEGFDALPAKTENIRVRMYGVIDGKDMKPYKFAYYTEFRTDPEETTLEPLMNMSRRATTRAMKAAIAGEHHDEQT